MAIAETKIKYEPESRLYGMDFARASEIREGETLTGTPTVTIVSGDGVLVIGSATINGSVVQFRLSAGTVGTSYILRVQVDTDGGNTLVDEGLLKVVDTQT